MFPLLVFSVDRRFALRLVTFAFRSGDWHSDAFRAYLALPLTSHTQVADIMAAGLLPVKQ